MPNDDNFNFLWYADGDLISGANARTLTLTQDLVGKAISAEVSYINMGDSLTVVSAPTGLVSDVNDLPSGSLNILGAIIEGEVLSLDTSSIDDLDGLGTFNYSWFADGMQLRVLKETR